MSEIGIAVVGAFAGGLSTYLLNLSAQSKANLGFRSIAIAAVKSEFVAARRLITIAEGKAGGLWAANRNLSGAAWEAHGWQLAGFLDDASLSEMEKVRGLLENVDGSVKRIQDTAGGKAKREDVPQHLSTRIKKLGGHLDAAISTLDKASGNAQSELRRTQLISIAAVAAIVVVAAVAIALPTLRGIWDSPAVTSGSIAKRLQAESPHSNMAVCDESEVFKGAFRCAIDFGGCDQQLEASTAGLSCPVPRQKILKVLADEDCFEATEFEFIEAGATASNPPGAPKKEEFHAGCIEE